MPTAYFNFGGGVRWFWSLSTQRLKLTHRTRFECFRWHSSTRKGMHALNRHTGLVWVAGGFASKEARYAR